MNKKFINQKFEKKAPYIIENSILKSKKNSFKNVDEILSYLVDVEKNYVSRKTLKVRNKKTE